MVQYKTQTKKPFLSKGSLRGRRLLTREDALPISPVVMAINCKLWPIATCAVPGEIVMESACAPDSSRTIPLPQPMTSRQKALIHKQRAALRITF
jgi:hypothetical protein